MGKALGAFVCFLIVMIDIAAGILGIQAEFAQSKMKHLRLVIFECKKMSHEAYTLGLAAASLLALAHVIANLLRGFACMCSKEEFDKSSANKQLATACFFLSWIIVAVGFSLLIVGTLSNSKSRTSCGITHLRYLYMGGILCFVHGLFCVSSYVCSNINTGQD